MEENLEKKMLEEFKYVADEDTQKELGQVWTPFETVQTMLDFIDEDKLKREGATFLDPTLGSGNIILYILIKKIVEYNHEPIGALKSCFGVEYDEDTLKHAKERIANFMKTKTDEDVSEIIDHNFVHSSIFDWDIKNWCKSESAHTSQLDLFFIE